MTGRQIDRIKEAEGAVQELLRAAAQLRQQIEELQSKDPEHLKELLTAAEAFEKEIQKMTGALESWRKEIN
jgi:polyhydroxyalkanoate synthesis regulator phasin